jgi:uncharacterized protein YbjT (DUF2867 family)
LTDTTQAPATLAIVGATGSNGRLAVAHALDHGLKVRAVNRSARRARRILSAHLDDPNLTVHEADATDVRQLAPVLEGVDAVVLAHGNDAEPESNYRVIAAAVETLPAGTPVSLMSAIAVTQDIPAFSEILEWRRRGERLLRASALRHTIIRPGWFDGHSPGDDRPEMEQGDATPLGAMRGVQRRHIAAALVEAVRTPAAARRTLELFSGPGEPIDDWPEAFAALDADTADRLDGVHDPAGLPLAEEPAAVRDALRKYGS